MERLRFGRGLKPASIAAFFFLLAAATSFPLILQPGTLVGTHGDALFSVWRLAWIAHQLATAPFDLFNANIFYPQPRTLAYSDAILLPGVAWAPMHWLGVSPLAAYNLLLLSAFALNGLAAFLLVRHLTASTGAGLFGGIVFAFAPFRFDHFDHLEMQFSFWMPLAVLAWHRGFENGRGRHFVMASACAAAQVVSCLYYGVFLVTWLGVMTVATSLRDLRTAVERVTWTLAIPVAVLALYSIPYLANREALGDRTLGEVMGWSATWRDFLTAPPGNVLYGWTESFSKPERRLFPGITAVACALLGLWPLTGRARRLHVAGLALALLLVLGFNGFLYPLLFEWVLPYRGLRVPARAMVLVLLSLAVLAGFGVVRLHAALDGRWRTVVTTVVIALASAEYATRPALQVDEGPASKWYETLADVPDAVIFEWPVSHPTRIAEMIDVRYMYRSTVHWRPLLNGYSGNYPLSYLRLLEEMRGFPDGRSLEYLRRAGATILVIHERPGSRPSYDYALDRLGRDPSITVLAEGRDADHRIAFFRLAR